MTQTALPSGRNGSNVLERLRDSPGKLWILDVNAAATKVFDGSKVFLENLSLSYWVGPWDIESFP